MDDKFEKIIKRLEEIVSKLESGNCELDEAIELYSEGTILSAKAKEKLETAKQKIENLSDYTN